jgi:hypothetical protein
MAQSPEDRLDTTRRRRRVIELRQQGLRYATIAERIEGEFDAERLPKSWNAKYACKDFHRALQQAETDLDAGAADLLRLELSRLNALQAKLWPKAMGGNVGAVDRILSIMKRRATYLGLDSPDEIRARVESASTDWLPALLDALKAYPDARRAAAEALAPLSDNGTDD